MKYRLLIGAGLRRRPLNLTLTVIAVASAYLLLGLACGFIRILPGHGGGPEMVVGAMAGLGFVLILFLTGNATAHGVRLRMGEFAVLKALGFSTRLILGLVFTESAVAILAGASVGLLMAEGFSGPLLSAFPHGHSVHPFVPPVMITPALLAALLLAALSTALPACRIARLDLATTLRGGET